MKLIIGLGNPGEEYIKTRHNVGFMVLDALLNYTPSPNPLPSGERNKVRGDWKFEKKFKGEIAKGEIDDEKIILAKPQTFMNNSGQAVKLLVTRYSLPVTDLWVINDDLDLPLGAMRLSFGASSAGHKGVQSIINLLKTKDFWRMRIGIGLPRSPLPSGERNKVRGEASKFVLKPFDKKEHKTLTEVIDKACEALTMAMENPEKAMTLYNK